MALFKLIYIMWFNLLICYCVTNVANVCQLSFIIIIIIYILDDSASAK